MKKSIVSNSIFNIIYKVVNALYPLIAVTYVSHVLQAEKMGVVSYAQNIVSYFAILAALGLPTYGTREIAKVADSKYGRSQVLWELISINTISTSLALIAYLTLIINVQKFNQNIFLYLIAGLQIVLNYINVDWYYQGMEEYRYISIRSMLVKIIALAILPVLVRNADDYLNYALIYCLAIAGNNIFNILKLKESICKKNRKLSLKRHIKPIIVLLIASLAVEVYVMIDTTMLGVFCDDSTVGCYSNAMKLVRCVNTTASAIGGVLFPRLSVVYAQGDNDRFNQLVDTGIKVMLMIAIPASVGLIAVSDSCVLVMFGESFIGAVPILKVLSLMIPVVVCNTLLGAQVLVTTNMEGKYVQAVSLSAAVNAYLNALLIPRFGATSAAWTSLFSELLVLCLYLYFSRNVVRLKLNVKFFFSLLFPLVVYLIFSRCFIVHSISNNVALLAINIIACCIIYFAMGLLLKNEAMIFVGEKVLNIMNNKFWRAK